MNDAASDIGRFPVRRTGRTWRMLAAIVVLVASCISRAAAPADNGDQPLVTDGLDAGRIRLTIGKSVIITTTRPYKRISIADPDIVLAPKPVGLTTVLLTPKKAGVTQFILWDDNEKSQMIDVAVQPDMQALQNQFKALFPDAKIEAVILSGTIVLRGRVPSIEAAEQAAQLAAPFGQKVLNMLEVAGGRQVMLQVRFAEVSRSAITKLGVNFGFSDGRSFLGSNVGQVNPLGIVSPSAGALDLGVLTPNPAVTIFGRATNDNSALLYFIDALRENNLLRILAEPNLTTTSGQEANFLAGGEFAIPVTQAGGTGGGTSVTIEYRKFGVQLVFVPVVLGDGRIRMKVAPEVSDLDYANAVQLNGFLVPGLTSRKVQTTVELLDGQTFAIAGLLDNKIASRRDVTPLLGDLPIVGALFRSVRYQRKETELVVLVTPRLVAPLAADQVAPLPGEHWRHPTDSQLFLNADIGGPAASGARPTTMPATRRGEPPRFFGQYGFAPVTSAPRTEGKH